MVTKTVLAAAVAAPLAAALPAKDTSTTGFRPAEFNTLIVGGEPASAGEFPYIVSLQRGGGSHFCGGTLIDANTVITAAHCDIASGYTIRVGSLSTTSGGATAQVSEVINHPDYDSNAYDNDIAIWKLSDSIPEGDGIAYASLPSAGSDPSDGTGSTVAGWGATSEGGSGAAELQKVDVPIVGREECDSAYGGGITEGMVCAGLPEGGKDACQGDSGGPLVVDGTLVGVVSWGNGCARPGYYGVYANVGNYIDWISQNA